MTIARRHFLRDCGYGLGKAALASLLVGESRAAPVDPFAAKKPHFPAKAKAVIHLFMAGAPSQLDLFDYKPALAKLEGKPTAAGGHQGAAVRVHPSDAGVLGPRFKFARHGKCGAELSEMLPHLAKVVDDIAILKSVHTDQFNHAPAQIFFNTGFAQPGRPSMGSWVVYGLGCETKDLPAFVVMSTGGGISGGSGQLVERLPAHDSIPASASATRATRSSTVAARRHRRRSRRTRRSTWSASSTASISASSAIRKSPRASPAYEMAYRLQTAAPELMDLKNESKETLALYGVDPAKPSFARACLLARRMVERGVRFVNIYHEGWDAHSDVAGNLKKNCARRPTRAARPWSPT